MAGCGPGHFTHAAAPNQLLGGGTQRLRRMLEVRTWHGVAGGTGRAGVVEGQGRRAREKGRREGRMGVEVDPGRCPMRVLAHTPEEARE